jgi:hypothetical protein
MAVEEVQAAPGDVAAAQPLHSDAAHAEHGSAPPEQAADESTTDPESTVAQAVRQAEVIAELRAELATKIDAARKEAHARPVHHADRKDRARHGDRDIEYGHGDDRYESSSTEDE